MVITRPFNETIHERFNESQKRVLTSARSGPQRTDLSEEAGTPVPGSASPFGLSFAAKTMSNCFKKQEHSDVLSS